VSVCPLSGGDPRPLPERVNRNRESELPRLATLRSRNLAGNGETDACAENEEPVCAECVLHETAGPKQRSLFTKGFATRDATASHHRAAAGTSSPRLIADRSPCSFERLLCRSQCGANPSAILRTEENS
jgi:hypothetical protein